MRTAFARLVVLVAFVGALWSPGAPTQAAGDPAIALANRSLLAASEQPKLRPMKKGVGRAVTSTMDKIDNPWFVLSQIVIPICVILFSLMYVRRHRARQEASAVALSSDGQGVPEKQIATPATPDDNRAQQVPGDEKVRK